MASICDLEPFLYESAPIDPVAQAAVDYYGQENNPFINIAPVIPPAAAASSGQQINDQKLEDYLRRFLESLCTDLQAIEARLTALEAP